MFRLACGLAVTVLLLSQGASAQLGDVNTLYRQGVEARLSGRFDEAIARLREAAQLQPDNADTQVQLGLALTGAGDVDAAAIALKKALELAPDYDDARIGLARIAFRRDRLAEAKEMLAAVLAREPDNVDAKLLAEQIDKALQAAGAQARRKPAAPAKAQQTELARLTEEARTFRVAGRFAEAETRYRAALRLAPENADLLVGLGLSQGFAANYGAARTSFEQALRHDPSSVDARLGLARVALWIGNLDEAGNRVAAVLADVPDNPDGLALRARVALAAGRTREAAADFAQIVARDPDNIDALVGLGDARRALLEETEAREAYERALALDPGSADVRSRLEARPPARWRLDIEGSYSRLSEGLESWREGAFRLGYVVAPGTVISGGADFSHRFGDFDAYIEARIDHRFSQALSAFALFGGTPDADFLPTYRIGVGGDWRISPGVNDVLGPTALTLEMRHSDYETGAVQNVNPGIEQYFFDGRLWLTARWINSFDQDQGHLAGWFLRADWQALDRLRLFGGMSDAPDVSEGVLLDTFSMFGGLAYDVNELVTLRASLAREDRRDAYDRNVLSVGLGLRF